MGSLAGTHRNICCTNIPLSTFLFALQLFEIWPPPLPNPRLWLKKNTKNSFPIHFTNPVNQSFNAVTKSQCWVDGNIGVDFVVFMLLCCSECPGRQSLKSACPSVTLKNVVVLFKEHQMYISITHKKTNTFTIHTLSKYSLFVSCSLQHIFKTIHCHYELFLGFFFSVFNFIFQNTIWFYPSLKPSVDKNRSTECAKILHPA